MKLFRIIAGVLACQMALLTPPLSRAQQPADPPTAPVPGQIASAKKVFLSNASGEGWAPPGVPDLTYNEFYADMKSWGRYELVSTPADADLVLEIRFTTQLGPTSVSQGQGYSSQDFQFRLTILDPKTRVVLWAFTESIPQSANKATSRKKFDDAMTAIVNDTKKLAGAPTS